MEAGYSGITYRLWAGTGFEILDGSGMRSRLIHAKPEYQDKPKRSASPVNFPSEKEGNKVQRKTRVFGEGLKEEEKVLPGGIFSTTGPSSD